MNYELCKALKDAGFPQPGGTIYGFICNTSEKHIGKEYAFCEDCAYSPTLSELIAETSIALLERIEDADGNKWHAVPWPVDYANGTFGKTLEIAVARLYLYLNTK